jgi:tetratricopeptide (TPR) repeat protein
MSYYDDLGVPAAATEADIKKAYFRKVRQHPPESDSIGFQRIRTAFETLSDATKRKSYDSTLKHGGRLAVLEKEASAFMEEEDWSSAEKRFKEIVLLDPERDAARNILALCLAYQDRHADAVKLLEQVIRRVPNDTTYRMNLGHCWLRGAIEGGDDSECLERALSAFAEVVKLEPFHSDAWLMRARAEFRLGRHDAAWTSAERAVAADGKIDIGDLEALFFMVELTILTKHPERVPATTARIAKVTGDNPDARDYATNRLLSLVNQLIELKAFQPALRLQDAASTLDPGNTEIRTVRDKLRGLVGSFSEFDRFQNDEAIPGVLRVAVAMWLADRVGEDFDASARSNIKQHLPEWARRNAAECRNGIASIQRTYPAIAEQVAGPLNSLFQVAGSKVAAGASAGVNWSKVCMAVVIVVAGLALLGIATSSGTKGTASPTSGRAEPAPRPVVSTSRQSSAEATKGDLERRRSSLDFAERQIRLKTNELEILRQDIESTEARMASFRASGYTSSYNELVPRQNRLVREHDVLREEILRLDREYQRDVDDFNSRVQRYNNAIGAR